VSEEEYIGIVGEIFDGYTDINYQGKTVYIKHFSIRDQRYIHRFYNKYKSIAESKGIPSEEEMLNSLRLDELWSDEDDRKIVSLEEDIEGLQGSKRSSFLPSQKKNIQATIESKRKDLYFLLNKKAELVGKTSERYGSQRSNEEFIRYLIYSDRQCLHHFFTDEDFAELSEEDLEFFVKENDAISQRLNESNIQHVVLRDFFNMYISQTEDVSSFYGKPIIELSVYQLKLAIYARIFFNMFQYHEDIPERAKKDPEAIFDFVERKKNNNSKSPSNNDGGASAVFGATKEDLEMIDPNARKVNLADEISKKGGVMNMDDLIELMG
jgi:hypothetical protein